MLKLNQIELKIGEVPLLKEPISIEIDTGQCVTLFGRNGKGKSTLLKNIAGIYKDNSDKIIIQSNIQSSTTISNWAKLCTYISGREQVNLPITTYDYLLSARIGYTNSFGMYSQFDEDICEKWISVFNITELKNKNLHHLSDGERQLVQLTRAFIYESSVILLDEPTANLDVPNKRIVISTLHKIAKEEKKLIIYSSHDFEISKKYNGTCLFIDKGGNFHTGNITDLVNTIQNDFGIDE